jgi:hypothetical protein
VSLRKVPSSFVLILPAPCLTHAGDRWSSHLRVFLRLHGCILRQPDVICRNLPQTCASDYVGLYVCSNFRILLAARCVLLFQPLDNPEGSIRKVSSLVDAALGLAEEAGKHSRRVLALRREMVCP